MNLIECCQKAKDGDVLVYPVEPNCEYEFDVSLRYGVISFKKKNNSWWSFSEFVTHVYEEYDNIALTNDWFLRRNINVEPITIPLDDLCIEFPIGEVTGKVVGYVSLSDEQCDNLFGNNCKYTYSITFTPESKVQEIRK